MHVVFRIFFTFLNCTLHQKALLSFCALMCLLPNTFKTFHCIIKEIIALFWSKNICGIWFIDRGLRRDDTTSENILYEWGGYGR